MTIGIILIVSILLLGGVLATLGDRIGTKVGKARLSLFKLRPQKTATLVTIATGVMIAGTTLGILFATSEPLRRGIFAYDRTLKKLRAAHRELKETRVQKIHVETQLAQARDRHAAVQQHLDEINQSLQAALAQQGVTEAKLAQAHAQLSRVSGQMETLGAEITQLQRERQELIGQRDEVKRQIARLNQAIAQRDREITQLDKHIADRDQIIGQRDQMIAERDDIIAQRELRLKGLETEQSFLERQVNMLQQYYQEYQELRLGNVALRLGQILADGVVRILSPTAAKDAVDHLLRQANKAAISQVTYPHGNAAVDEQVIQITQAEVEQLTNRISNGKDYVVRILSAGNYVYGENAVRVFADVALNKIVFLTNEVVASGSVDASRMSEDEILQRLDLLMASSKFRARRAGILGTTIQIADGSPKTLVQFIEHLMITKEPLEIQAVAAEVTYTAGPLKIELVAIRDDEVLFRT
ncbi:MAG: DUF3084 domain-containing protein [Hormoscilla sp. GUM202]|nr:DUF3084 domain-containing protein [Hormoscilla sp. GUM202]